MFVIGITGGIGSGKSFVSRVLKEEFQAAFINTDKIGHELLKKGKTTYEAVLAYFGEAILNKEGEIDRKSLGNLVFSDKEKLEVLNHLLHPSVEKEVDRKLAAYEKEGYEFVCIETAILFEVGYEKKCNEVWFVFANEETRLKRLVKDRNLSEKACKERFRRQKSEEDFKSKSDRIIDNSKNEEDTVLQIRNFIALIRGGKNAGITGTVSIRP